MPDEHNRALPVPVFPTPFYETIASALLFLVLWSVRKRIKVAGTITGIYFILNGTERFLIEKIRVNNHLSFMGLRFSQAELIAFFLVITGIAIITVVQLNAKRENRLQ